MIRILAVGFVLALASATDLWLPKRGTRRGLSSFSYRHAAPLLAHAL
jgi:hypothetical protein